VNGKRSSAQCSLCNVEKPQRDLLPVEFVRPPLLQLIEKEHPEWKPEGFICTADLNHYRMAYVGEALRQDVGEISVLETEVLESLKKNEVLSANIYSDFDSMRTAGESLADKLAMFGGSWKFILFFGGVLAAWIAINTFVLADKPFDPFPFILLNLVLSCLAALQAPIIMMSQNRLETRDRLRAEHDYKINLKAELEIRHLHEKLDHLLKQQWSRLLEIQGIQLELMQELAQKRVRVPAE
jgi:uncharacterized membrane protein